MKTLLLLFFVSSFAQAKVLLPSKNLNCISQVESLLTSFEAKGDWKILITTNPTKERFTTPTKTFGKWIYLENDLSSKKIIVANQTQFEMMSIEFDEKCSRKINYKHSDEDKTSLNDNGLKKIADSYSDVLVYIWSPEMPLSMKTLPEVKKFAEQEKIPLKVFLYAHSSQAFAEATVRGENYPIEYLQRLKSFELSMSDVEAHQPALFRYKKGMPFGRPQFGYKTVGEYSQNYNRVESK
jgi:hypothetical protein